MFTNFRLIHLISHVIHKLEGIQIFHDALSLVTSGEYPAPIFKCPPPYIEVHQLQVFRKSLRGLGYSIWLKQQDRQPEEIPIQVLLETSETRFTCGSEKAQVLEFTLIWTSIGNFLSTTWLTSRYPRDTFQPTKMAKSDMRRLTNTSEYLLRSIPGNTWHHFLPNWQSV